MTQKTTPLGYLPAWRSKSSAARLLGINRKTIQRKVRSGELIEDPRKRICVDKLAALLTADDLRKRRGPKVRLRTDRARPRYEWNGTDLVKTVDHEDPADKIEGKVNAALVSKWQARMVKMNTATLRAIANDAMTIARHRAHMARLGFTITPDEMIDALRRGQADGMTANHRLASAAVTNSR